jgi:4-hydroxy-tetrahydrodipicolinate reductase
MIKICVAGAAGRMGRTVLKEAFDKGFEVVGAVGSPSNVNKGKSLKELGICDSDIQLLDSSRLEEAVGDAEVYMTFTTPGAEMINIPKVVTMGKRIILGTTGFSEEQARKIHEIVSGEVPTVFSPNFSLGINVLLRLTRFMRVFPPEYDFSITEIHHSRKRDAPSGTAKKICEIVANMRRYSKFVYGREGLTPRTPEELEVSSLRLGGVPGIHDLIVAGPHEMIRIEHIAFSRSAFAQGALYAAEWISKQEEAKIYSMDDVLALADGEHHE